MCNQPNCRRLWRVCTEQIFESERVCLAYERRPLKTLSFRHLRDLECSLKLVLYDASKT